jgi:hypothetical protein
LPRPRHKQKDHTIPQFDTYVAPAANDGDRYKPKENFGHVLVIKALEHKTGVITENSPEGTDAISAHLVDLDDTGQQVYRDTLLFGGALVDGLKGNIGKLLVIRLEPKKGVSGRTYPIIVAATDAELKRAEEWFATHADPFAPTFTTVAKDDDQPPF